MFLRRSIVKLTALALASAILMPQHASAHPHVFATARLEVVLDAQNGVKELRNVWLFDPLFSSSVILDFDQDGDLKLSEDELAEVGSVVRESLADFGYYMSLSRDGRDVAVKPPEVIHVSLEDQQLLMFFAVEPTEAMPLAGKLSFGVYDPTMYVALDFISDDDMVVITQEPQSCGHDVVRPDPDEIIAQNQATLTEAFFNDPGGNDISSLFATRLELTC